MKSLFIGTPTIDQKVYTGFLHTCLSLQTQLDISVFTLGQNSSILDARNQIFTIFINSDKDYLLFLDSDVEVSANSIINMINTNKDIIGIPVLRKNIENPTINMGNIIQYENDNLVKVDGISTSCLMISKKVALSFTDRPKYKVGSNHVVNNKNNIPLEFYDVFHSKIVNGSYINEDYLFCKEVLEKGFDIYALLNEPSRHYGVVPFEYTGE